MTHISSLVRVGMNALTSSLLAPTCATCEAVLDEPLSGCVCAGCWAAIRPITPPVCDVCGDPLPRPAGRCAECQSDQRCVTRARAVGEYEGTLRDIIHALKYGGRRSLARPLGALMQSRGADIVREAECVVPVPLHWRREHTRGFNQAREIARHLGLPVVDALIRLRHTRAQVELAAERRSLNVAGAFGPRRNLLGHRPDIDRMKVLLVDDVTTTGATLESCARVLRECGASEVFALTAARVPRRR